MADPLANGPRPPVSGALQRSLAALSFGIAKERDDKKQRDAADALVEREQQFQIPFSGLAIPDLANTPWVTADLDFELSFPSSPQGMRDADFDLPTVYFGYEMRTVGKPPAPGEVVPKAVAIYSAITDWYTNEQDDITGAQIAATALAVGSSAEVEFTAVVHVVFQGWGAPIDDWEDTDGSGGAFPQ